MKNTSYLKLLSQHICILQFSTIYLTIYFKRVVNKLIPETCSDIDKVHVIFNANYKLSITELQYTECDIPLILGSSLF